MDHSNRYFYFEAGNESTGYNWLRVEEGEEKHHLAEQDLGEHQAEANRLGFKVFAEKHTPTDEPRFYTLDMATGELYDGIINISYWKKDEAGKEQFYDSAVEGAIPAINLDASAPVIAILTEEHGVKPKLPAPDSAIKSSAAPKKAPEGATTSQSLPADKPKNEPKTQKTPKKLIVVERNFQNRFTYCTMLVEYTDGTSAKLRGGHNVGTGLRCYFDHKNAKGVAYHVPFRNGMPSTESATMSQNNKERVPLAIERLSETSFASRYNRPHGFAERESRRLFPNMQQLTSNLLHSTTFRIASGILAVLTLGGITLLSSIREKAQTLEYVSRQLDQDIEDLGLKEKIEQAHSNRSRPSTRQRVDVPDTDSEEQINLSDPTQHSRNDHSSTTHNFEVSPEFLQDVDAHQSSEEQKQKMRELLSSELLEAIKDLIGTELTDEEIAEGMATTESFLLNDILPNTNVDPNDLSPEQLTELTTELYAAHTKGVVDGISEQIALASGYDPSSGISISQFIQQQGLSGDVLSAYQNFGPMGFAQWGIAFSFAAQGIVDSSLDEMGK